MVSHQTELSITSKLKLLLNPRLLRARHIFTIAFYNSDLFIGFLSYISPSWLIFNLLFQYFVELVQRRGHC